MMCARQIAALAVAFSIGLASASTQEYLGIVESGSGANAAVKTVTVMYVSHEVSPGTFEMFDPNEDCLFMINDQFCTREAFLSAVRPGRRLYCRGNRSKGMFYGLYSTPYCDAEGVIASVDGDHVTVTHTPCYRDCTPSTISQSVTVSNEAVIRYEGENSDISQALAPGRHVRVYGARAQIVQTLTPGAWLRHPGERAAAWPWTKEGEGEFLWGNEGYIRGLRQDILFFAGQCIRCTPAGATDVIDTYQKASIDEATSFLLDGHYAPSGAGIRPGDRCLLVPDRVIDHQSAYKTFVIPADYGALEGRLKSVDGSTITLETASCPTGQAADHIENSITVTLRDDARYHRNGIPGATAHEALEIGSFVRVLPAWEQAVLVRDIDRGKERLNADQAAVAPWFTSYTEALTVTEFDPAQFFAGAAGYPSPRITWLRDGAAIDGATDNRYRFFPTLADDGATFSARAVNSAGEAVTPPIVLSVAADTEPPRIANAFTANQTEVVVVFSKTVERLSAESVGNYTIDPDVEVRDASLGPDGRGVALSVSSMTRDQTYTLTVSNVTDIAATPNAIADQSAVTFTYGVTFRFLKFTLTQRAGSFSSEICELRYEADNAEYGLDALYSGELSDGEPYELFDESTGGGLRWNTGSHVIVDLGPGNDIAPDAALFHTCGNGRHAEGVMVEGSRDGANWIELAAASGEFDGAQWHRLPIDLSSIDPDDIVKTQPVWPARRGLPISRNQPVSLYTVSGRLIGRIPAHAADMPGAIRDLPAGIRIIRPEARGKPRVLYCD